MSQNKDGQENVKKQSESQKGREKAVDNSKGALQGVKEGVQSSVGSSGGSGGAPAGGTTATPGKASPTANQQGTNGQANRVQADADRVKTLSKNIKSGDLQRGIKNKAKDMVKENAKHPVKSAMNPTQSLDKEDSKNIAKGAVQYATGNGAGLAETVADEANHISESGRKGSKDDNNKSVGKGKDRKDKDEADDKAKRDKKSDKDKSKSDKDKDEEEAEAKKTADNLKKAGAAGATAAKGALAVQAASMFKMMLSMMMAMLQALAAAVTAIVAATVNAAAAIAVALGVSMAVAVSGIVGVVVIGVIAIVSLVSTTNNDTGAARDGYLEDEDPCALSDDVSGHGPVETSGDTLENEKKIYSFFKNYGYPDEQIAGMLGCFVAESGVDATGMEAIYGEPFSIGPEKQKAWDSLGHNNDYMTDTICRKYINSGWKINGYKSIPTDTSNWDGNSHHSINAQGYWGGVEGEDLFYPGIGLGQFTGGRARNLLLVADSVEGYEWYDIECQLAFMVSTDSKATWIADWAKCGYGKPEEACRDFLDGKGTSQVSSGWEGITPSTSDINKREKAAADAYSDMGEWEADSNFYNTIVEIAGDAMVGASTDGAAVQIEKGCSSDTASVGNGLAERMSQYCLDSKDEGIKSYEDAKGSGSGPAGVVCGSELYIKVHQNIEAIRGDDPYYASCDRGVGYAILWSGADDDVSFGGCVDFMSHLASCNHWKNVKSEISSESDLKPGDVLIHSGHVVMYIGPEAVQKYHPDADASWTFGAASYGDYAPNVQSNTWTKYTAIYRNVKTETDSKYIDAHND